MNETDEFDGNAPEPRTAMFPVVHMPAWAADVAGYVLIAGAAVAVLSGVISAISYRITVAGEVPPPLSLPRVTIGDRIRLVTELGAGSFAAVLLLLGVVCLVIADQSQVEPDRRRLKGLVLAGTLAAIVAAANLALDAAILVRAHGDMIQSLEANRVPSIVTALAPIALAGGVLAYLGIYFRSEPEPDGGDG